MTKRVAQIGKFFLPIIVGFFIGRTIYRNWDHVRATDWQFSPLYLLVSILILVPWFIYRPFVWKVLLGCFGYTVPYGPVFRITRQAEMSRYVPGTVWQYLSRVYLAGRWGVPATACLGATLVESVMLLLAALPLALLNLQDALPAFGNYQRRALTVFLLISVAVVHPRLLNWWVGILARYAKRPYRELQISWLKLAGIWLSYLFLWLSLGLGIAFFVRGIMPIPFEQFPSLAGDYAAAWIAAIVTVVAPAGMGVRDGVFGLLLSRVMPLGTAFTVAVAVRLWLTLLEIVAWGLALSQPADPPENEAPGAMTSLEADESPT